MNTYENLVSFETAKLLKEKGFTDTIGIINGKHYYNYKGELDGDQLDFIKASLKKENLTLVDNYPSPTLSLAQKWLREKHNIYVLLEETQTFSLITGIGFYYKIIKVDLDIKEHLKLFYSEYFYSTYEEALEEGILHTLKLIKND